MPWSDIDFIIQSKTTKELQVDGILPQMETKFRELPHMFAEVKYIGSANVPIVKATCTKEFGSKKIDITVQDGKHTGMKCVELVERYLNVYPCLRYLVLPLKQLLFNSGMNNPYEGGLTSYALVLMIVSFLQYKLYNKQSIDPANPNLGSLFIEFLTWYAQMDHSITEIRPMQATSEVALPPFVQGMPDHLGGLQLTITDPLNHTNNVARATYKFHFLKVAM